MIGISEEHDFHHTIGKYNYGISVFMDKLFGTYHNPKMNFYYGKYINKNYNNDDNNDNNDNNNDRITKFKNKN
jgi:sterol desaturase/sphingolipid hydroxylase (fatty acid hydroxylase superfamily)